MDKSTLTVEELSLLLAEKLKDAEPVVDEAQERALFKELKGFDGIVDYLRTTAARDIRRYFGAATKEEQLLIRGAFARTMYLKTKILEGGQKKTKIEEVNYQ